MIELSHGFFGSRNCGLVGRRPSLGRICRYPMGMFQLISPRTFSSNLSMFRIPYSRPLSGAHLALIGMAASGMFSLVVVGPGLELTTGRTLFSVRVRRRSVLAAGPDVSSESALVVLPAVTEFTHPAIPPLGGCVPAEWDHLSATRAEQSVSFGKTSGHCATPCSLAA